MPTWAIALYPKSGVAAEMGSHTLFGALCWALRRLYGPGEVARWVEGCQAEPPALVLSSAFPFVEGNPPLRFFPKPLTLLPDAETAAAVAGDQRGRLLKAIQAAKALGKATYLSETLLAKTLRGTLTARELLERFLEESLRLKEGCLLAAEEEGKMPPSLWRRVDVQHTAVDRVLTSAAEGLLYFDTEHFFGKRTGLFFLLRCPEEFPLEPILRLWRHDGLGGNRSVGKGHFEPEAQPAEDWLTRLQPSDGQAALLLSSCLPRPGEFQGEPSVYRLVARRPKFESAYGQPRRVSKGIVRHLAEGSVLVPTTPKEAYGRLLKVGDMEDWEGTCHPVYHNGIALALRMVMPHEVA